MKLNYKIGDIVEEVDVRNINNDVDILLGLSIDKCFIKSVANVIGTDLTKYKIISKYDFAVSLMQVSRDSKIPIACLQEYNKAIVSPAYHVFRIKDKNRICPEYLELLFRRSEFDREAAYIAVGGVRGSMPWSEFCRINLSIPPIEKQLEIVHQYKVISDRIVLKQKINDKLKEVMQLIYEQTFVKNPLNINWKNGVIGDVLQLQRGHDLPKEKMNGGKYPVIGSIEIIGYHNKFTTESPAIILGRSGNIGNPRIYFFNCWAHNTSLYVKNFYSVEPIWALFLLKNLNYDNFVGGSAVPTLNRNVVHSFEIKIPPIELQRKFNNKMMVIFKMIDCNESEIQILKRIEKIILSQLSE